MNNVLLEYKRKDMDRLIQSLRFSYGKDSKLNFLKYINETCGIKTTKLCKNILAKTINNAEVEFNKEWKDFSENQVDSALYSIQSTSIITMQSYVSLIKRYLVATTPNGDTMYRGFHYTMGLTKDDLEKYVSVIGKESKYITPDEFEWYMKYSKAPNMTKAIAVMIYLGFKGGGFRNVYDLKTEEINFETGEVSKDGEVVLDIPEKYMDLFRHAHDTTVYSQVDQYGRKVNDRKMELDTEYFLKRRTSKRTDATVSPDSSMVSTTMIDFQNSIPNSHLNGISLYVSGETYRLLEYCDMQFPTHTQLMAYRGTTGSTLSYVTMKAAAAIILDKLGIETPQ